MTNASYIAFPYNNHGNKPQLIMEIFIPELMMLAEHKQTTVTLRHSAIDTLKGAAFTCTAERLAAKLMTFSRSKWASLKTFTISHHIVTQVEKRLDIPTFDWNVYLTWAQQSLNQWVLDEVMPDFPPFTLGSPHIVLIPDQSLPEAIADKEARIMSAAGIKASMALLTYINFDHLGLASVENLLGVGESDGAHGLSQMQRTLLACLREKTDALKANREEGYGWLNPWERAVAWNPWVDFAHTDWFKEPSASKRAVLSRSLQNLVDRGLLNRHSSGGSQQRNHQKQTTHVSLTELGYLSTKLAFSQGNLI